MTNRGIAWDGTLGPHVIARYTVDTAGGAGVARRTGGDRQRARGIVFAPDGRMLFVTCVGTQPEVSPDDDGLSTFSVGADPAWRHTGSVTTRVTW